MHREISGFTTAIYIYIYQSPYLESIAQNENANHFSESFGELRRYLIFSLLYIYLYNKYLYYIYITIPKVNIYTQMMAHLHGGTTTFAQPHCFIAEKWSILKIIGLCNFKRNALCGYMYMGYAYRLYIWYLCLTGERGALCVCVCGGGGRCWEDESGWNWR